MDSFSSCDDSVEKSFKRSDETVCKRTCPLSINYGLGISKRGAIENTCSTSNVMPRIGPQTADLPIECSGRESDVPKECYEFSSSILLSKKSILCDGESTAYNSIVPEQSKSNDELALASTFCTTLPSAYLNINGLPHWILVHIFSRLSLADRLLRAALVCRYWHKLTEDPDLWRQINLVGQPKVDDDVLARVVRFSNRVISVDVTDCRRVTDVGMENMLSLCKDIQKLTTVRCQHFTKRTFKSISEMSGNLQEVNLSCCFSLDDESLMSIGTGCRLLKDLKINQCSKVTDYGVTETVGLCPNLVALSVDQCTQLKGDWIETLVNRCSNLKLLSCKECPLAFENIKLLSQLSKLSHLEISGNSNVTDSLVISLIRGCQQLEYLNLSLCHHVTNESVIHLVKYGRCLQSLYLVSCAIDNKALESLAASPTLQTLDIAYCGQVTFDGANLVSSRCKNLRYLGLMRCDQITHKEAEILADKFPHIHFSSLWLDCKRVIEKAKQQGVVIPVSGEFYGAQQTIEPTE